MRVRKVWIVFAMAIVVAAALAPRRASAFTREEEQRIIRQLESMQGQLRDLGERVARIEGRLEGMDKRLDGMDKRLDGMDKRLDGMDRRLDGVEKHVDRMVSIMLAVLGLIGVLMGFTFWFARKDVGMGHEHEKEISSMRLRLDRLEGDFSRLK